MSGCDSDCMQSGSNWSVIYTFMASTYMLIAANAALGAFGSFYLYPRVISSCCNCLLTLVFLAAIITTAVYRFRTKGQLCALSENPSHVDKSNTFQDRTYNRDGKEIVALWVFSMVFFFLFIYGGQLPVQKRKKKA